MSWNAPVQATTGQVVTAAFWNAQIYDNFQDIAASGLIKTGSAVDLNSPTLTTTLADKETLSFVLPTGWVTALINAWGSVFIFASTGLDNAYRARIEIGANNGPTHEANVATVPEQNSVTITPNHEASVSGNVTIAIAAQKVAGATTTITPWANLNYVAIRTS